MFERSTVYALLSIYIVMLINLAVIHLGPPFVILGLHRPQLLRELLVIPELNRRKRLETRRRNGGYGRCR
jgi:hypothetical protein